MMAERAAIYIRVSTDEQRYNYSLVSQLEACVKRAEEKGWNIVGDRFVNPDTGLNAPPSDGGITAYQDDYTGTKVSRPAIDAALEYARTAGYERLIVNDLDRLGRGNKVFSIEEALFEEAGVKVEFVLGNYDDTADGRFRKELDATLAGWENDKRIERVTRGKKKKAELGKFVAGRPPYGYTIDKEQPGGLAVNERQAAVVRLIFERYVKDGASIRKIAEELTAEGVRPWREGDRWGKSTIQKILCNEAYVGRAHYNKHIRKGAKLLPRDRAEWIPIDITALVDEATFAMAQLQLSDNRARARKQPKRRYLLTGLVICEECGMAYHAQAKRAGKHRHVNEALSYRHRVSSGHCLNRTISARRLEPAVWEAVTGLLLDPASLRRGYEASIERENAGKERKRLELGKINDVASKLNMELRNLVDMFIDPDFEMTIHLVCVN